jgi:DNA mismatch repair protein MutL
MARIHVLSEAVANQIAAGEVVERPASVAKELLENALDAGASRIKILVEAGGRRLVQLTDNGCGMVRDDALLAFERHATSKIKNADDLLRVTTLGFRGEALPSIASVSRLRLETRAAEDRAGTVVEINGGRISKVEEAGLPLGTSITVRDLFFNTPARRKFLKSEPTELSHIASLVTHYALAHPDKHFELHTATHALLIAAPVLSHRERVYQVFGQDTLDQLLPVTASVPLERIGLPQPPPWKRPELEDQEPSRPGELRIHGFASKPEIQKLNRNSIFVFVNRRLIRDRLIQHALTEAYRNILPASVFPVVLLFLETPRTEVDVNVHPSKTEVRFRQQSVIHDFVRDAVRAALMKSRPVPEFTREINAHPTATPGFSPVWRVPEPTRPPLALAEPAPTEAWVLTSPFPLPTTERLGLEGGIAIEAGAAVSLARGPQAIADDGCVPPVPDEPDNHSLAPSLGSLKPLGQIRSSFILAVDGDGLWIVDQHVAHERVLFEKVLKQRSARRVESQRLLMPLLIELTPAQQVIWAEISGELELNGFEAEPFGTRTIAVKTAPTGLQASQIERMLHELLDQFSRREQHLNMEMVRNQIAASIACHAAIKVNMPLEQNKMEWLLAELAKTDCPMTCPHGRPVVLRYSMKDIQRAFKRI